MHLPFSILEECPRHVLHSRFQVSVHLLHSVASVHSQQTETKTLCRNTRCTVYLEKKNNKDEHREALTSGLISCFRNAFKVVGGGPCARDLTSHVFIITSFHYSSRTSIFFHSGCGNYSLTRVSTTFRNIYISPQNISDEMRSVFFSPPAAVTLKRLTSRRKSTQVCKTRLAYGL